MTTATYRAPGALPAGPTGPSGITYRTCPRSGLQFEGQAEKLMIVNAVTAVVMLLVGGIVGLLLFNTSMQQASFAATSLESEATPLAAREQTLQRVLAPAIADYDVILIDCQPSLGLLTVNALTASDGVIVPLECEYFSLRGVALLVDTIDKVKERLNPKLTIDGVLGTMYDGRTLHGREVMERLVQAWGDTVFHTVIRRTVKFSDSTVAGEPITTYAGTSAGADAAFAAAVRYTDGGAFPCHPRGKGFDLVQTDVRSVANATFCGPAGKIVLYAIAFKDLYVAGVHTHRNVHFDLAAGHPPHHVKILVQPEQPRRAVKTFTHRFKRVLFIASLKSTHIISHWISHC